MGASLGACLIGLASQSNAQALHASRGPKALAAVSTGTRTPELFGTQAQKIAAERFWDEWERALRDASGSPRMRALIQPAIRLSAWQQIRYVQSAVTRSIGWRSDATQWGRHDYWASADETLSIGLGDMEDRAIVKMHALRALGFSNQDLYLTLGRDNATGPQTVLVVRHAGRYLVLDDTGSSPFAPERRPEFTPVLTFGFGAVWAHMRLASLGGGRPASGKSALQSRP
jgi:predicted transglutaminase-like cysteine proteinase